jgi:putative MATE family efflux protein
MLDYRDVISRYHHLAPGTAINKTDKVKQIQNVATSEKAKLNADQPAILAKTSMWSAIRAMYCPLILAIACTSLVSIVDVHVAGFLGSSVQAAVGLAEQLLSLFTMFLLSISVGTTAIVSRARGENDYDGADYTVGQSLSFSICIGIFLAIAATITAHGIFPVLAKSPDVISQSDFYFTIYALYLVPFSVVCISNAAFRAIGNARVTLIIVFTELIINIAGDYLTVLGNWPVPGLGIKGIAASSIAGALVAASLTLYFISRSPLKNSVSKMFPLSFVALRRISRVGIPSAIHGLSWSTSMLVVFFILKFVEHPTAALASWTIGMRIACIIDIPLIALRMTVAPMIGQCLGARDAKRAIRTSWSVALIAVIFTVITSCSLFLLAQPLAQIFTRDPKTVEYTVSFLNICALTLPFHAVDSVLMGALQGAGDTRGPMWIFIFTNWIVRLPLAWWLSSINNWNPVGVWLAIAVSAITGACMIVYRFTKNKWLTQTV